jgi:hypothetical protein
LLINVAERPRSASSIQLLQPLPLTETTFHVHGMQSASPHVATEGGAYAVVTFASDGTDGATAPPFGWRPSSDGGGNDYSVVTFATGSNSDVSPLLTMDADVVDSGGGNIPLQEGTGSLLKERPPSEFEQDSNFLSYHSVGRLQREVIRPTQTDESYPRASTPSPVWEFEYATASSTSSTVVEGKVSFANRPDINRNRNKASPHTPSGALESLSMVNSDAVEPTVADAGVEVAAAATRKPSASIEAQNLYFAVSGASVSGASVSDRLDGSPLRLSGV